jgi:palmitoyltransferase
LGDKLVTDKQKAEALAKLDKAFESTERVLGGVKGLGRGK